MNTPSRRDVLKLLGGSLAGIFLTPLPWKLLDDTSIMTQTGPWIAKDPRGPLSIRYSTCTLCSAGCGVCARSVAGVPFSLSPVVKHPLSFGTLCAAGLAAHYSAYHPLRVRTPLSISHDKPESSVSAISFDDAKSRLKSDLANVGTGSVAILDLRPGRTASLAYRKLLGGRTNGYYIVSPRGEMSALDMMCEKPYGLTGIDLEHAKLIVSFGAPLLEVWGNPSRLLNLPNGDRPAIFQVETRRSRTAIMADEWIPISPRSETAFALGLAHEIIHNGSYDVAALHHMAADMTSYIQLVNQYPPERVAELTGVRSERIVDLSIEIVAKSPAIIVNGSGTIGGVNDPNADIAIMGLNLLLGNLGREGGIVSRNVVPIQSDLAESVLAPISSLSNIPDRSIQLLIIDDPGTTASLPWEAIERKLSADQSGVVCFSPYFSGVTRKGDILIPTAAPFEAFTDNPVPPFAMNASFTVAAPFLSPPGNVVDPLEILGDLFSVPGTTEQYLRGRVDAILKKGEGTVFGYNDGSMVDVKSIGSPDEFWNKLVTGGLWLDEVRPTRTLPKVSLLGRESNGIERMNASALRPEGDASSRESRFTFMLLPFTYAGGESVEQVSPLMTKVFQESGLRSISDIAVIDPVTAHSCGLNDGDLADLETSRGSRRMKITIDQSVMPHVIHVAVGPDPVAFTNNSLEFTQNILSLVELDNDCAWKPTPANLRKV